MMLAMGVLGGTPNTPMANIMKAVCAH